MGVQIDSVPRPQNDISGLSVTLGAGNPGSGVGVQVIIDDLVITSEADAFLAIESIKNEVGRRNWPIT